MTNQRSFFSRPRLWGLPWGVLWGLTLAVAQFFTPAGAGTAQAAPNCTDSGQTVTCTYPFTGASETWTVPEGVTQATFQLVGAPGGRSGGRDFAHVDGGRGADLKATLSLVPGTDVIIIVGGPGGTDGDEAGGFNGGGGGQFVGNSYPLAGGGGGATDIRIGGTALTDRVLVAGGGGGGGSYGNGPGLGGAGGTAGGVGGDADMSGFSAPANGPANGGGGGASGNAGGQGGAAGESTANPGGDGSLGQGGTVAENRFFNGAGGGGGGGYVGGGGGGAGGEAFDENANSIGAGGGGGGGGSSFASASATNVALTTDTTKVPKVVITYVDTVAPSVSINQAAGQADPTTSNPVLFSANFNEPVIGFTAQDVTLSGTANLSNATITVNGGPQRYTISVAGLAGNGTVIAAIGANRVTDLVGNGNRASTSTDNIVTVNFDSTPPVITSNVAGTLGSNGWYVSNVTVSWSVVDNESTVTSQSGCDPVTVNSDTVGVTLTCTATSSGGSSSQNVTIKRDATAPTLSAAASSAPNANGWYNRDVTVPFTCNDNLSGVVSCPADETLSREGAAVGSTAQTITDQAGNRSAASNVVTVQIDKTAPVVTVTGVSNGASYPLGSAPAAGCSTSDALSGVATQATLSLTGAGALWALMVRVASPPLVAGRRTTPATVAAPVSPTAWPTTGRASSSRWTTCPWSTRSTPGRPSRSSSAWAATMD